MQASVKIATVFLAIPLFLYIVLFVVSLPIYLFIPCGTICSDFGTWFFILFFACPLPVVYALLLQREKAGDLTILAPRSKESEKGKLEFITDKGKVKTVDFSSVEVSDLDTLSFKIGFLRSLVASFDSESQALHVLSHVQTGHEKERDFESIELQVRIFQFSRVVPFLVILPLTYLFIIRSSGSILPGIILWAALVILVSIQSSIISKWKKCIWQSA